MDINLELFPHQMDFILSKARHTALVAGYGAGKSYAGVAKTVLRKMEYNGIPCAYYLPTYGLIKDIAFPKFSELLTEWGVPFRLNRTEKDIYTPYGLIHLRSMDKPDTIVGYEVGYSLIDETDILPTVKMTDVFTKIIARNRRQLPSGHRNQTDVVGTPEGFKWLYNFFVKGRTAERVIVQGKTSYNTTLPAEYIEALSEVYSDVQLRAYLEGEFVNLNSGTVYREFDRYVLHTDRMIQKNDVLHIGMDFNVTNMNAVVNVIDDKTIKAVAEETKIYDTFEMIDVLKEKYSGHQIVVYPDASGKNRKTSSRSSDHELLRKAGFTVRTKESNPLVRDRVNAMNASFKNAAQLINTNNCPRLTEALENQAYKDGEPDKTTGYDHINEAQGYIVSFHDKIPTIRASYSFGQNK